MKTANRRQSLQPRQKMSAFTMVELIIVIVVIAILVALTFAALNINDFFQRSRDSARISDIQSLNKRISLYQMNGNDTFGAANTVYLSLPDSNANCSSHTLPALPAGWSYACRPAASYRNIDGTGWIPIDLSTIKTGATSSTLAVDPSNTASGGKYYSYSTSGRVWELNAQMESDKEMAGGAYDKTATDGGDDPGKVEIGSNLAVAPWSLEFVAFPTVAHNSGYPGWYKHTGTGTIALGSDGTSPHYIRGTGYSWHVWQYNIPFNPDSTYKMTCRVRQVTDPTVAGNKYIFCGWTGMASDKTTYVNLTGANSYGSQHYQAISSLQLAAGGAWADYTGYTKGWGAPNGTASGCSNPATPCQMHQNVRYFRPLIILNYPAGDGIAELDSITITKQ